MVEVNKLRNEKICSLRYDGWTLQQLGDEFGISKERVRQIIKKHRGTTCHRLITRTQLSKLLLCDDSFLRNLEKKGILLPIHRGFHYLYDAYEMDKAIVAVRRYCVHCGKLLPPKGFKKYCLKCRALSRQNAYRFLSEEGKRKHREACIRWQKENPERYKVIMAKAKRKYYQKMKE